MRHASPRRLTVARARVDGISENTGMQSCNQWAPSAVEQVNTMTTLVMASTIYSSRQCRRSTRRRPLLVSVAALFFVLFCLVDFIIGAAAADAVAAAEGHTAGVVGRTKAGLGAAGSDVITITSKNFKETVRFQICTW